jgi:hypothetical protein
VKIFSGQGVSSKISSSDESQAKKQNKTKSDIAQEVKCKSKDRRQRIFATGKEEGIKEGKKSAEREIASLKATNDALHKRLGEILEQSNGSATGQLVATETATRYLVENTQLRNQIAAQEHTIAAQTVELEALKQINKEKDNELAVLRVSSSQLSSLSQTGPLPVLGSVKGPSTSNSRSVYLRR